MASLTRPPRAAKYDAAVPPSKRTKKIEQEDETEMLHLDLPQLQLNPPSISLATLPVEIIGLVVAPTSQRDQMRLWATGDRRLLCRLERAVSHFVINLERDDPRGPAVPYHFVWAKRFTKLSSLRICGLRSAAQLQPMFAQHVPQTLIYLALERAPDFPPLHFAVTELPNGGVLRAALRTLCNNLPHLRHLTLPAGIGLSVAAPSCLETLTLTGGHHDVAHETHTANCLPCELQHLVVRRCRFLVTENTARCLPTTLQTLVCDTIGAEVPAPNFLASFIRTLPRTLTTLWIHRVPDAGPNDSPLVLRTLFRDLPRTLTSLVLPCADVPAEKPIATLDDLAALPQSLTKLTLPYLLIAAPNEYSERATGPFDVNIVHLPTLPHLRTLSTFIPSIPLSKAIPFGAAMPAITNLTLVWSGLCPVADDLRAGMTWPPQLQSLVIQTNSFQALFDDAFITSIPRSLTRLVILRGLPRKELTLKGIKQLPPPSLAVLECTIPNHCSRSVELLRALPKSLTHLVLHNHTVNLSPSTVRNILPQLHTFEYQSSHDLSAYGTRHRVL